MIGGTILLALGAAYEVGTSREALFPPQLFKDVSCGSVTSPFRQIWDLKMTHSFDPYCGVPAQFLLHYWNLLYRHLFSGEILMSSEKRIRQLGGLTFRPLYRLGRGWDVSTRRGDGFSPIFTGVHPYIHSGCMVHGLLAS